MTDTQTPATLYYVDSGTFGEIVVREVAVEKVTPKTVTLRHQGYHDATWTSRVFRYTDWSTPGSAFAHRDAGNSRDYYRSRDGALKAYCLTLYLAAQSFRRRAQENDETITRAEWMIRDGIDDPKAEELKAKRMAELVRDRA